MLYITTRNDKDAFTAPRTLNQNYAPDMGLFVPYRLPVFSAEEICKLKDKTIGETVAEILNLFFSSRLNSWDVEFTIGRNPVKLSPLNNKTVIAELWHNPDADINYVIQSLYHKVCPDSDKNATEWFSLAVRIAFTFASFGEMQRQNTLQESELIDAAVSGDNLSACLAVIFARKMGLPIQAVISGCSEGAPVLELLRRGTINTKVLKKPSDTDELERLIYFSLGIPDALHFSDSCARADTFVVNEGSASTLGQDLFAAAIGQSRTGSVINSTYRTSHYLIDSAIAMALAGLQDYRSGTGANRIALLLADISPARSAASISQQLGIPENNLCFS